LLSTPPGCRVAGDEGEGPTPGPQAFSLVVLPDTQFLTLDYPSVLEAMNGWTVAQRDHHNIRFVLHEGDMVHTRTQQEWSNAATAMSVLDGEVPYALCVGNHDIDDGGDTAAFNRTFPLSGISAMQGFGGVYEADRIDNAYYLFQSGSSRWLILSLIFEPDDDVLTWADEVVAANPERRVLLLTHAYLTPAGTRSAVGERIWDAVVRKHANVTFVLNGHYTGGETARLESVGDQGNTVFQLFVNFQTSPLLAGLDRFRLMHFDPAASQVHVRTYSPIWQGWSQGEEHDFVLEGVEMGQRSAGSADSVD
jgi:hypothetical protein